MKTVVGVLLNYRGAWAAAEPVMHQPPHHRPPVHPVLYLKPANTWVGPGEAVRLPQDVTEVEVGATLGVVIGRTAARVTESEALAHVAGYAIVNDVTVPGAPLLRPPLKHKCRDNFCPIGPLVPARGIADPHALGIQVFVNGQLVQSSRTDAVRRRIPDLLAEITEFMTLEPGDIVMLGVPEDPPRARAGDRMAIEIDGLGRLENPVEPEEQPA